ncbi:MAG: hypothetical protein AAF495_08520 [Pseudomonadota bacterium]
MALTLAELEAKRDRLLEVLGKGHKSYHFANRGMEYADPEQLKVALAEIEQRIAALQGGPLREIRIKSSKGL